MGLNLVIFTVLMLGTVLISVLGQRKEKALEKRKEQSTNLFRENILKKKIESFTEGKVKYSKRYAIESLCLQAGIKLTFAEYIVISGTSAIVCAVLVGIGVNNPLLSIMFLFIGYMLPKQVITFMKNRRVTILERQIGPFMHMVIKRYEATKDFASALELTMHEFKGEQPIYGEIKQTVLDIKVGVPLTEAMDNMGRRTGNAFMMRFADYYKIASNLGTDAIRKKLLMQAYQQFEENRKGKAMLKKQLSSAKTQSYILLATIPLFAIYQTMVSDTYIEFMTTTTTGQIGTAIISFVFIGSIWFINNKIGAPLE